MRSLITVVVLAIAVMGCTPVPESRDTQAVEASGIDAEACRAGGGTIRPVCKRQVPACVTPYKDAGRRCTDNSQCDGRCILDIDHEPAPDEKVSGRCEQDDDPCGCKIEVMDGRVGGGACVD